MTLRRAQLEDEPRVLAVQHQVAEPAPPTPRSSARDGSWEYVNCTKLWAHWLVRLRVGHRRWTFGVRGQGGLEEETRWHGGGACKLCKVRNVRRATTTTTTTWFPIRTTNGFGLRASPCWMGWMDGGWGQHANANATSADAEDDDDVMGDHDSFGMAGSLGAGGFGLEPGWRGDRTGRD